PAQHSFPTRRSSDLTPDYVSVGKLRTLGYKNALKDEGIEIDENLIRVETVEELDAKVKTLFDKEKFDAVFGVNELYAVVAMREADRKSTRLNSSHVK